MVGSETPSSAAKSFLVCEPPASVRFSPCILFFYLSGLLIDGLPFLAGDQDAILRK